MKLKSLIFDMDGVLWKDNTPLTNLSALFQKIESASINFAFVTNNSTKTPTEYQEKLANFGVKVHPNQIFTSGTNLAIILKEKFSDGGPVYIIGEIGLINTLKEHGFFHQNSDVLAVAGGLDRAVTYDILKKATILINQGAPFYFTNPDPTYPSNEGNIPGAGAILVAIEAATGVKAITPGKPEPFMFLNALKYLNTKPKETLVIGDRIDTDILGGINAECKTALVLSGVTSNQDLSANPIIPDLISTDVEKLINELINSDWEIN